MASSRRSAERRRPVRARTPTVLQMEAVECGAASLGIILGYHGLFVPLAELREACGVSRDGSKASNILAAARRYGLEAYGYKKDLAELPAIPGPYIVFWHFDHFLVLEGFGKGKVYLNDPDSGPRTVGHKEFDENYTGIILRFGPGPTFRKGGKRPLVLPAIRERLAGSVSGLTYCVVAGFLAVPLSLAGPVLSQVFVDQVLVNDTHDFLRPLLLGMLLAGLIRTWISYLQLHFLRRLRTKLAVVGTGKFLWHCLRLPIRYYAQRSAGELSSRAALNDQVAGVLSGPLATTAIDVAMIAFYLAVMGFYDLGLTVVAFSFAALNFLVLQAVARHRADASLRLGIEYGKAGGTSINGLQGIETLKAAGLEPDFFKKLLGQYAKATTTEQKLGIQDLALGVLPGFLSSVALGAILVLGGMRVMSGDLTIGMLVAFQSLTASFLGPVGRMLGMGGSLQTLAASLTRLDDVLRNRVDPAVDEGAAPTQEMFFRLQGQIEIRELTFGYSPLEPPLIEGFNLSIRSGQRVALVGGSGSGKSTVAKLICGLYQPWGGDVTFDGRPRSEVPRRLLSNSIALVDQDLFFFSGTVRDNLTLWDSTVPDRDLVRALKDAEIHDVVVGLPGGKDGELLEGASNLSGGQRQRMEIARALAANPSILILDEATSALDTETERIIDQNLRRRGVTCLIVAHRLSTIRDCDEILVMDRGKVVQRGTHDQLKAQGGHYAELIRTEGEALAGLDSGTGDGSGAGRP